MNVLCLINSSISSSSTMPTPYVKTTAHGAQVDREFLITSKDRKVASQPRKVEDPIAAKAASQIVRSSLFTLFPTLLL